MATVNVLTAERTLQIENNSVVDASIDESGHLILEKGDAGTIDVGSIAGSIADASTTTAGKVELATLAETNAGTDPARAVTPASLADILATIASLESGSGLSLPFKTFGPAGSGANFEADGTDDHVQLLAARAALPDGGVVWCFPGEYNMGASITNEGDDTYDNGTQTIVGSGSSVTIFNFADDVDAITITSSARLVVKDISIKIGGSGSAFTSTIGAGTPELYEAFRESLFENIRVTIRAGADPHTGWAFDLGSAFRSRFCNVEIFNLHNGMRFFSEDVAFNPGDCTMDRVFIELDTATGSIGLQLDSTTGNGSMNQMTFNMVELIDAAAGGTAVQLIGDGVGGSNHHLFTGINIEQFETILDVQYGTGNRFDFNYIETRAGGTFFKFGANASGNHIRHVGMLMVADKTCVIIDDSNEWAENPNTLEDAYIAVDTGGVATVDITDTTRILNMRGYNDGTLAPELRPDAYAWEKLPRTLTDAATIATNASLGNYFRVTLGGNRTLGAPTKPRDGQKVTWEFLQDGTGSRTLTLATGAGGFIFGTDFTSITLTTTAAKRDLLGAIYNEALDRWLVVAFLKGF